MPVGAIVQARMTSSRLPGKVLLPAAGEPLLAHLLRRIARAARVDRIVVACTDRTEDDAVAALAAEMGVAVFRGSEHDVLGRFIGAAALLGCDRLLRITADCPLLDPAIIDAHVAAISDGPAPADYVWCGEPPVLPNGFCLEGFRTALLHRAAAADPGDWEREHVTPWMRSPGSGARIAVPTVALPPRPYRLCVDTPEDYRLVRSVIDTLLPGDPHFTAAAVLDLLDRRPDLAALNAAIGQTTGPYRRSA